MIGPLIAAGAAVLQAASAQSSTPNPGPAVIELTPASPSELAVPPMTFLCVSLNRDPKVHIRVHIRNDKKTSQFDVWPTVGTVFSAPMSELAFSDDPKQMMLKVIAATADATSKAELLINVQRRGYSTAQLTLTSGSQQYAAKCAEPPPPPPRRLPERGQ